MVYWLKLRFLDEIFIKNKIRKIYGHTISSNKEILTLHKICGFEIEGILKEQIVVGKKKFDIILTSLFRKNWVKNRIYLLKKYKLT